MIRMPIFFWLLTAVCWSPTTAVGDHWPRFRGPNADGVAQIMASCSAHLDPSFRETSQRFLMNFWSLGRC